MQLKIIPLKFSKYTIRLANMLCPHLPFNDPWVLSKQDSTTTLLPLCTSCQVIFSFPSTQRSPNMTNTFALLENFCVNCLAYQRRITPRVGAVVQSLIMSLLQYLWDFAGSPVVKTPCSHCRRCGLIPGWRTKIPHAAGHGQKNYSIFHSFTHHTLF